MYRSSQDDIASTFSCKWLKVGNLKEAAVALMRSRRETRESNYISTGTLLDGGDGS